MTPGPAYLVNLAGPGRARPIFIPSLLFTKIVHSLKIPISTYYISLTSLSSRHIPILAFLFLLNLIPNFSLFKRPTGKSHMFSLSLNLNFKIGGHSSASFFGMRIRTTPTNPLVNWGGNYFNLNSKLMCHIRIGLPGPTTKAQ